MNGQDMADFVKIREGKRERDGKTRFEFHSNESVKLFRSFVRSFFLFPKSSRRPGVFREDLFPLARSFQFLPDGFENAHEFFWN